MPPNPPKRCRPMILPDELSRFSRASTSACSRAILPAILAISLHIVASRSSSFMPGLAVMRALCVMPVSLSDWL